MVATLLNNEGKGSALNFAAMLHNLALFTILCFGAYLGVVWRFDLAVGVEYLFSSFFVWLAALTLGPIPAVFVAFFGGSQNRRALGTLARCLHVHCRSLGRWACS